MITFESLRVIGEYAVRKNARFSITCVKGLQPIS